MSTKIIIIGGDAAGMSAASKVRREMQDAELVVFEKSPHISYAACGMPYWFNGVVKSEADLLALTLEDARNKRGIDVRVGHEVTAIDPAAKTVTVHNWADGESWAEPYDKLVIATGASAVRPPLPGLDLPGVFTLRSLEDGQRIKARLETHTPKRGVIIGAGYIGLEVAEAFHDLGMATTVIEMLPQIMPNMDGEIVAPIAEHLAEKGVDLRTSTKVTGVRAQGEALVVETDSGEVAADMVLVSVGVKPNSELARDAGLALGPRNAIRVDEHLRTSDPDIYAAGDCVAYRHLVLDEDVWIPLAPSANKGGRIVGENLVGENSTFPGILGTAVVKVFDYSLAVTGLTERQAQEHQEKTGSFQGGVASATIKGASLPHYYPGGAPVTVKIVLERATGRILGAQLASKSDISKRADIFAVALTAGMTVQQFGNLDLTYAPPFAPVYDPVIVAANVAVKKVAG